MAHKITFICRKCSLSIAFMLLLQVANAQADFSKAGNWLKDNVRELGGRAVLVIFKDGKIVFNKLRMTLAVNKK